MDYLLELMNLEKSAPYKDIYKHFGLTSANITSKLKKMMRKKI